MACKQTMEMQITRRVYEVDLRPSQWRSAKDFKKDVSEIPDDAKLDECWQDDDESLHFKFTLEVPAPSKDTER